MIAETSLHFTRRISILSFISLGISFSIFICSRGAWGISSLDAQFRLQRKMRPTEIVEDNPNLNLYRRTLVRSLSSRCRWYPSDSQFTELASEKCGIWRGTLMGLGRFFSEFEAHELAGGEKIDHGHLRFIDLETNCDL